MTNEMKMTKSIPRRLGSILAALIGLFFLMSGLDSIRTNDGWGFVLEGILLSIPFFAIAIGLIVADPKGH
jgi:hypothetical protein